MDYQWISSRKVHFDLMIFQIIEHPVLFFQGQSDSMLPSVLQNRFKWVIAFSWNCCDLLKPVRTESYIMHSGLYMYCVNAADIAIPGAEKGGVVNNVKIIAWHIASFRCKQLVSDKTESGPFETIHVIVFTFSLELLLVVSLSDMCRSILLDALKSKSSKLGHTKNLKLFLYNLCGDSHAQLDEATFVQCIIIP